MSTWRDSANCAGTDPDTFTPNSYRDSEGRAAVKLARRICHRCLVMYDCLVAALDEGDVDSIRGATTPGQRASIEWETHHA